MNYSKAIFLINPAVRAVMVNYEPDKPSTNRIYKTLDQSIVPDDYVIIPTDSRHKLTVARVTEVDLDIDMDSPEEVRWIVGVVDRKNYDELVKAEQEGIKTVKAAELRKKREEMKESIFAHHADTLNGLKIAHIGDASETTEPPSPPPGPGI